MFCSIKKPLIAALVASAALWSAAASAGSTTLLLARSSLSNDSDADGGGLWQYEGGALQNHLGTAIGTYILQRRVTTSGTQTYNTAAETITLFFAPANSADAPPVITIEGSYSYNSGAMAGSVSAAGNKYNWIIGSDVSGSIVSGTSQTKLLFSYAGSDTLRLP